MQILQWMASYIDLKKKEKRKDMNIEEIENKLNKLEETVSKMKELISDAKICSSEITKKLISNALDKYAAVISEFKLT